MEKQEVEIKIRNENENIEQELWHWNPSVGFKEHLDNGKICAFGKYERNQWRNEQVFKVSNASSREKNDNKEVNSQLCCEIQTWAKFLNCKWLKIYVKVHMNLKLRFFDRRNTIAICKFHLGKYNMYMYNMWCKLSNIICVTAVKRISTAPQSWYM